MTLEQLLADTKPALLDIQQRDLTEIAQAKDWQAKYRVLMQLGKTGFINREKPTPLDEAVSLIWFLVNGYKRSCLRLMHWCTLFFLA